MVSDGNLLIRPLCGERIVTSKAQGLPLEADRHGPHTPLEVRFTQLYDDNFDFVWRSIRMLGLAPDAADDAAQDVFLVAHRRLADFEERASPRTWLFAIALRVVSDHRRSRRRKLRLLDRLMGARHEPANSTDAAISFDRRDKIKAALETLPEEQRVVLVLSDIEEMSAPEIADALEVKLNTVYSRLRTARKSMAARLQQLEMQAAGEPNGGAS